MKAAVERRYRPARIDDVRFGCCWSRRLHEHDRVAMLMAGIRHVTAATSPVCISAWSHGFGHGHDPGGMATDPGRRAEHMSGAAIGLTPAGLSLQDQEFVDNIMRAALRLHLIPIRGRPADASSRAQPVQGQAYIMGATAECGPVLNISRERWTSSRAQHNNVERARKT